MDNKMETTMLLAYWGCNAFSQGDIWRFYRDT